MAKPYVWIGITIGIFFAGIGIGYLVFINTNNPGSLMQNQQFMQKMMQDPNHMQQMMNNHTFMRQMMNDPNHMKAMMADPQFMQQMMNNPAHMSSIMNNTEFMTKMMQDPEHIKHMQDPKHLEQMREIMKQNPLFMQGMMSTMMQDPEIRQAMVTHMMQSPQFMQTMMQNSQFQNQWMGPWMMNSTNWGGIMGPGIMMGSPLAKTDEVLSTIDVIENLLDQVSSNYKSGDANSAFALATTAYIENYEYIEGAIASKNIYLMEKIELMLRVDLRNLINTGASVDDIDAKITAIKKELNAVRSLFK